MFWALLQKRVLLTFTRGCFGHFYKSVFWALLPEDVLLAFTKACFADLYQRMFWTLLQKRKAYKRTSERNVWTK
jgi:hypothetical protein